MLLVNINFLFFVFLLNELHPSGTGPSNNFNIPVFSTG